jgi:hypothetical protein
MNIIKVKPSVNGSIPLLLQISTLDSSGRQIPIEEIPIWTDPTGKQTFGHSIFPYLAGPDKIFIVRFSMNLYTNFKISLINVKFLYPSI